MKLVDRMDGWSWQIAASAGCVILVLAGIRMRECGHGQHPAPVYGHGRPIIDSCKIGSIYIDVDSSTTYLCTRVPPASFNKSLTKEHLPQ
jgi:hypothetical protein